MAVLNGFEFPFHYTFPLSVAIVYTVHSRITATASRTEPAAASFVKKLSRIPFPDTYSVVLSAVEAG